MDVCEVRVLLLDLVYEISKRRNRVVLAHICSNIDAQIWPVDLSTLTLVPAPRAQTYGGLLRTHGCDYRVDDLKREACPVGD